MHLNPFILGALPVLARALPASTYEGEPLTVNTSSGIFAPFSEPSYPNVAAFLDIPFAETPVGDLRFSPPVAKGYPGDRVIRATKLPPSFLLVFSSVETTRTPQKITRKMNGCGKLDLAYPSYTYEAEPGFAEHDLDEYDGVSAELAWSRSLAAARKVFGINPDLELVLEHNLQSKFFSKNLGKALSTFTTHKTPHVTYMPTLTGATGAAELKRFYSESFTTPPSLQITLLSRTIGVDRVVDEMHVQFKHTEEVQWILPGVPPTNKKIEILMVSIVAVRGGRLYQEH
ncbi:dienelactone hydrolase [Fusarium globosum]|uniref:Dienelactone hydrolase n=1 Tax=Fusarium globosum TaxID=78864 RepID=A0A8H6CZS8_9HYPO|nr:dienelactone hydrolase [Fusarium globosum]